ncbi:MAG: DUF4349 domain-containing protein [Anaerolineae bacterium]|nr:DUF4349 domain-containing protein [Anaerolineae bacterium]
MKITKIMSFPILIMLIMLMGLTACAGSANESASSDMVAQSAPMEPMMEEASAEMEYYAEDAAEGVAAPVDDILNAASSQAQQTRVIIYTGDISLVVQDTQESVDAITAMASEMGGFISGSNVYESGDVLRGSITVRVPADRYQDTLAQLREMAIRVERENSTTQDVTEEFTDLQARKTNLEFTEEALQQLLEERQRVGSTSDILEVYRELTSIRGQIEQIEGRLRYLANQSALSTITIQLTPDVLYQPVSIAGWEPQGVAKEALQSLVAALQGLVNVLIWGIVFVLPLLLVLLIPVVIVALVIRRWWGKRSQKTQDAAAQS